MINRTLVRSKVIQTLFAYYKDGESTPLTAKKELLKSFDGGKIVKQANGVGGAGFMVLVGAMMPAVLIELGFISNLEDEAYMMTAKGQQDLAERVAKAVTNYKAAVHSYRETLGR